MAPNKGRGSSCACAMLLLLLPLPRPQVSKFNLGLDLLPLLLLRALLPSDAPTSGGTMALAVFGLTPLTGWLQHMPGTVLFPMPAVRERRSGRSRRCDLLFRSLLLRRTGPSMQQFPPPARWSMLRPLCSTSAATRGAAADGAARPPTMLHGVIGAPQRPSTPPAAALHAGGSVTWLVPEVIRAAVMWSGRLYGEVCCAGSCWLRASPAAVL